MSLFPAYGQGSAAAEAADAGPARDEGVARWEERENELLASSDSEPEAAPPRETAPPPPPEPEPDYYVDRRFDGGNLRVSTIYYPGRPQYHSPDVSHALGLSSVAGASRKRARRYWERAVAEGGGGRGEGEGEGEGERGAALRRALVERPRDERLWLQYIDYQEWVCGDEAGLAAAEAAAARLPRAPALRARRHRAARRALSPRDYLTRLRDELAKEKQPGVCAELWARLVSALAAAEGVEAARVAAEAAVRAARRLPAAYPHLLYTYGCVLRAAGLWETLVLLLELVLGAGGAGEGEGAEGFPPPRDLRAERDAELRLQDYEDKVVASGLPSGAVWARVERARAAAHWRPARPGAGAGGVGDPGPDPDPQRAPSLAAVADLLLPCAEPLLPHVALRLAKVPLLPGASYVYEAAGAGGGGGDGEGEWEAGECLLALVYAARRLPPAHAARAAPAHARDLVQRAVDPPHYFSDDYGYAGWVEALWEAALGAAGAGGGAEGPRAALLGWRLRWLHAQLLLLPECGESAAEARRLRSRAQQTLKRWGAGHAAAFAQFARLARAAEARGVGGAGAGRGAALQALRAALRDPALPHHHLLYIARIVEEVSEKPAGGEVLSAAGAWALASAVLRRALPGGDELERAPPPALLREAAEECSRRCAELEEEMEAEEEGEPGAAVLGCAARVRGAGLPGEAEWGAARVALAPPAERARLLRRLLDSRAGRGRARRWRTQQACALALAPAGAAAAPQLAEIYPGNVLLELMAAGGRGGGGGAWWCGAGAGGAGAGRSPLQLVTRAWPALVRAAARGWEGAAAGEAARRLRRLALTAGAGGLPAPLSALRLEAEARAPRTRLETVAHQAIDHLPHHKWLVVRSAALGAGGGGGGGALPDVLLERALRLHALPDELRALAPPQHPPAPTQQHV